MAHLQLGEEPGGPKVVLPQIWSPSFTGIISFNSYQDGGGRDGSALISELLLQQDLRCGLVTNDTTTEASFGGLGGSSHRSYRPFLSCWGSVVVLTRATFNGP